MSEASDEDTPLPLPRARRAALRNRRLRRRCSALGYARPRAGCDDPYSAESRRDAPVGRAAGAGCTGSGTGDAPFGARPPGLVRPNDGSGRDGSDLCDPPGAAAPPAAAALRTTTTGCDVSAEVASAKRSSSLVTDVEVAAEAVLLTLPLRLLPRERALASRDDLRLRAEEDPRLDVLRDARTVATRRLLPPEPAERADDGGSIFGSSQERPCRVRSQFSAIKRSRTAENSHRPAWFGCGHDTATPRSRHCFACANKQCAWNAWLHLPNMIGHDRPSPTAAQARLNGGVASARLSRRSFLRAARADCLCHPASAGASLWPRVRHVVLSAAQQTAHPVGALAHKWRAHVTW